ncbi:hypothetical protein SAMN05660831_00026 [Thiohalospira halophila DSM 15071]|uniref:Flagellar transcriptional activator FlhC n=1 Tax=Thiohalospira halophila DSM 15071 TaxID=1123397 RepID=A0A1I1MYE1_9GAMM|nr:hypothetical protein [Thiohalospira halophila]SFC90389.1 hypothetical protein SAMN05660831_00026 [Thiohalospira halophila DSM 15071]
MSRRQDRGAGAWLRWTYRTWEPLRQTQNLIIRGLRPQVVAEITGIQYTLCQELRRELLPNGPVIRSTIPSGIESRAMRSEQAYRAGSVFVVAYLNAAGAQQAARSFQVEAWCAAFDLSQQVCERLGWTPLPADYAYVIAREMTNPEELVYEWCNICGAPFYRNHWIKGRCPFCRELEEKPSPHKTQPSTENSPRLHAIGPI